MAQEEPGRPRSRRIERIRARQERHRRRSRFVRIPFAAAGFIVLLLGVIMLFTPGPGWAVIVFGLGLLALEFDWAERWLVRVIHQIERASEQVKQSGPLRRVVVLGLGVLALAGLVVLVVLWDLPLFPG